jgi:hypothetical protein
VRGRCAGDLFGDTLSLLRAVSSPLSVVTPYPALERKL